MTKVWFRRSGILMLALFLGILSFSGCTEVKEFDADELFSLEDMASDIDYAVQLLTMMNRWRPNIEFAVEHLGANPNVIPFSELVPEGWSEYDIPVSLRDSVTAATEADAIIPGVEDDLRERVNQILAQFGGTTTILDPGTLDSTMVFANNAYTKHYELVVTLWYEQYYERSFQDANQELIRFDWTVPDQFDVTPRKVEYLNIELLTVADPSAPNLSTGDSIAVYYTDDYSNVSNLSGEGRYADVRLVFYSGGGGGNRGAGMINIWEAEMTNLSPIPNNPKGDFIISGITTIDDLSNRVDIDVRAEVHLRANGTGSGWLKANGEKQCEIEFDSFTTSFNGVIKLLKSKQEIEF
ncbi:hypothetical protein K8I28_12875 [bacterium]|nr:hypothetical protein [bacterium]